MKLSELNTSSVKPYFGDSSYSPQNQPGSGSLKMSDISNSAGALASSQKALDGSKVFTTPLHTIAAGGDIAAGPMGALKGALSDFASAGAQNAGPIGADMLAHAPEFAKNIQALKDFTQPANTAEAVGAGQNTALQLGLGLSSIGKLLKGGVEAITDFARGKLGTRTLEEVKAVPQSEVSKLNPIERKAYFDAQKQNIDQQYMTMEEDLNKKTLKRQQTLQQESDNLVRQADVASRDETIKLRPKAIKAMGEQSQEYRKLVEDQISSIKDEPVARTDLEKFLSSKFADNPDYGRAIADKLGMSESGTETTIGKIYQKMTGLGQDIGTSAKKGSRTFTPDEKMTDDAIHTLTDFMKERGVDFSEARKFWAQYAPVRNQMVNTIRPFNQAGTETKGFASLLTRVAKGNDVNNENFIVSLKDLIGEDIGTDTKTAIAKLDTNAKTKFAADIEAKAQEDALAMAKDKAITSLDEASFEAERKARLRKIIKTAIVGIGAYEANKQLKQHTGIGF